MPFVFEDEERQEQAPSRFLFEDEIDTEAADYFKAPLAGALKATGYGIRGVGQFTHDLGEKLRTTVNDTFGTDFEPEEDMLRGAGDYMAGLGNRVEQSYSPGAKAAIAGFRPTGNVFKPEGEFSFGENVTPQGVGLRALDTLGQIAPIAATALATRGGGMVSQMGKTAGVSAAMGGGGAAVEEGDRIRSMTNDPLKLSGVPAYRALREEGVDHESAVEDVARIAESGAFWHTAPVSALTGLIVGGVLSNAGQRALSKIVGTGTIGRITGGVAIGAPLEGVQEIAELSAQQYGASQGTGEEREIGEGSFEAGMLGMIGGAGPAVLGGAMPVQQEQRFVFEDETDHSIQEGQLGPQDEVMADDVPSDYEEGDYEEGDYVDAEPEVGISPLPMQEASEPTAMQLAMQEAQRKQQLPEDQVAEESELPELAEQSVTIPTANEKLNSQELADQHAMPDGSVMAGAVHPEEALSADPVILNALKKAGADKKVYENQVKARFGKSKFEKRKVEIEQAWSQARPPIAQEQKPKIADIPQETLTSEKQAATQVSGADAIISGALEKYGQSKDKFHNYLRERLGKKAFAERTAEIEQAWASQQTPKTEAKPSPPQQIPVPEKQVTAEPVAAQPTIKTPAQGKQAEGDVAATQAVAPSASSIDPIISRSNQTIKIPITIARNRLRGKKEGALFADEDGSVIAKIRDILKSEAKASGFDPTKEWLTTSTSQLLRIYEKQLSEWEKSKGDTIGFAFEGTLPSGTRLLMADQRILDRIKRSEVTPIEDVKQGRELASGKLAVAPTVKESLSVQKPVRVAPQAQTPQEEVEAKEEAAPEAVEKSRPSVVKENVTTEPPKRERKIEDFGEKLGGARKDKAAELRESFSRELGDDEVATLPLSKIWPKESIDQIEDTFLAAFAHSARAEIPAKPRKSYYVKGWVVKVKVLRDLVSRVLDGKITKEKFKEALSHHRGLERMVSKVSLLESIDRANWDRIGEVSEYPDAYSYGKDGKKIPSPSVYVGFDGKNKKYVASNIAGALDQIQEDLSGAAPKEEMKFEVRGREGAFSINKKGDKFYRKLKTFKTGKEAMAFLYDVTDKERHKANRNELVAAWEAVKEKDNVKETDVRSKENRKRTAKDWRDGKDITPETFTSQFGFRGSEFGNWVTQGANAKERQGMLNAAYDGLMDLSDILSVPPKAISLNGSLGLGFGSRGHGWASAHFEPDTLVINLTKTRGAGALAHEWFHALDNYFQRERISKGGETSIRLADRHSGDFITYNPETYYVKGSERIPKKAFEQALEDLTKVREGNSNRVTPVMRRVGDGSGWRKVDGVRPEVGEAFADLVTTLNESPMAKRASLIDKGKSGGYWSRIIELGARSFENYIIHKMMLKGYHNDYLANVTPIESFGRDPGRYPYLVGDEIKPVEVAFDNLFDVVKAKETEKGVALYSKGQKSSGLSAPEAEKIAQRTFGSTAKNIRIIQSVKDLPSHLQGQGNISGVTDSRSGEVYLVADRLSKDEVRGTVLHEFLHSAINTDPKMGALRDKLLKQFSNLHSMAEKGTGPLGKWVKDAYDAIPADTLKANRPEELAAYALSQHEQNPASLPAAITSWVKSVIAAIKVWLARHKLYDPKTITPADLSQIAKSWMRRFEVDSEAGEGVALYSKKDDAAKKQKAKDDASEKFKDYPQSYRNDKIAEAIDKAETADPLNIIDRLQEDAQSSLLQRFKDKAADWQPSLLGGLTLQQLVDIGSKYLPQMKGYQNSVARMRADMNEMQGGAAKLAEKWAKWGRANKPQAQRLNQIMHDATLWGTDPAESYVPLDKTDTLKRIEVIKEKMRGRSGDDKSEMMAEVKSLKYRISSEAQRKSMHAEMKKRFASLPKEARDLYVEVRDSYAEQSKAQYEALKERIKKSDTAEDVKASIMDKLHLRFMQARLDGPYFPLARFGEYWAEMADSNGERVFLMFESSNERRSAIKRLETDGSKLLKQGRKLENARELAGTSAAFMGEVSKMLDKVGGNKAEEFRDALYQLYLQQLPDLSMRKAFIHRQKVKGFNEDSMRAYAYKMFHGASQIARLRHSGDMENSINTMKDQAKTETDSTKHVAFINEMQKRHQWIMNPGDSSIANKLTGLGFVWHLGLGVSSAMVNLTQTPVVAMPIIASKYGFGKASAGLLKASTDFISKRLSADEKAMLDTLEKRGVIDRTMAHDLAGIGETPTGHYSTNAARAMRAVSFLFHNAERFNREVTALAAYRLAGKSEASIDYAMDVVEKAHFNYGNENRARWMQSNAAKVLLLFKQYALNMSYYLWRNAYQTFKGESKEVKKEALKQLTGTLGMTALLAGASGLPLYGVMMGVANSMAAMFGDDDEWDAQREFYAYLKEQYGKDWADKILRGAASDVAGLDLASRTQLDGMWLRAPEKELEGKAYAHYLLEQAAGPVVGGILTSILRGTELIGDGETQRGIEAMSPKFARDIFRTFRYADEGAQSLRGDPLIEKFSAWELAAQAGGFTPERLAETYNANSRVKGAEQVILDKRSKLMSTYSIALLARDYESMEKARKQVQEFNKKHPRMAISGANIRQSAMGRARFSKQAEDGIVVNRKLKPELERFQ